MTLPSVCNGGAGDNAGFQHNDAQMTPGRYGVVDRREWAQHQHQRQHQPARKKAWGLEVIDVRQLAEYEADSKTVDELFFGINVAAAATYEDANNRVGWMPQSQGPAAWPAVAVQGQQPQAPQQPAADSDSETEGNSSSGWTQAAPSKRRKACWPRLAQFRSNNSETSWASDSSTHFSDSESSENFCELGRRNCFDDIDQDEEDEKKPSQLPSPLLPATRLPSFMPSPLPSPLPSPSPTQPQPQAQQVKHEQAREKSTTEKKKTGVPKQASEVLKVWFFEHIEKPYPSAADKKELCQRTGMSHTQIRNWFTNMRKRHWSPVKQGREPRSYVDFILFKRMQEAKQDSTK